MELDRDLLGERSVQILPGETAYGLLIRSHVPMVALVIPLEGEPVYTCTHQTMSALDMLRHWIGEENDDAIDALVGRLKERGREGRTRP
jgi:hypothetical protein